MNNEDADIRAAINAVAGYASGQYKRDLVRRMTEDVAEEVARARLEGKPIDSTKLFVALADKYVN